MLLSSLGPKGGFWRGSDLYKMNFCLLSDEGPQQSIGYLQVFSLR